MEVLKQMAALLPGQKDIASWVPIGDYVSKDVECMPEDKQLSEALHNLSCCTRISMAVRPCVSSCAVPLHWPPALVLPAVQRPFTGN